MQFKPIDIELVRSLFEYNPTVGGSCLTCKQDRFSGRGYKRLELSAGDRSGAKNPNDKYWYVWVKSSGYLAHRLVWAIVKGEDPPCQIDHINGDRGDNRIENLRLAPKNHADNGQNQKLRSTNKSGYPGVSWWKDRNKWHAQITKAGVKYHLGDYDTPEEAYEEYLKAKAELHDFQPTPRTHEERRK